MLSCYLDTFDKTMCTGCRACEMSCPKNAIKMVEDNEGFLYPVIDEGLCVHCDFCRKCCPVAEPPQRNKYIDFYAAQAKDEKELANSSSGGCFITIAKKVVSDGGVVFGCVFDDELKAVTVAAHTYEELLPMQGSKYVQCDVGDAYKQAKELLQEDKTVLYTGTPCQIAALKKFLGKEYDNLITMDFLCHGVPSGKVFSENIKYLEEKYGGKVSDYKFRDKTKKGWGSVTGFSVRGRRIYQKGQLNAYVKAFRAGYINRISCYTCKFVGQKRFSDITVADFWDFSDDGKEFDIFKGVSIFMVNTEKGKTIVDAIRENMVLSKRSIDEAVKGNGSLESEERSLEVPEVRDTIYHNVEKFGEMAEGILRPKNYKLLLIVQKLPRWCEDLLRKIMY